MELSEFFRNNPSCALAFSGGVDSSYLLYEASRYCTDLGVYYVKSVFQPDFELQDAKSYAAWGYDYLKYDWCSYGSVATGEGNDKFRRPYLLMGRFLAMQPRDIVFSLC